MNKLLLFTSRHQILSTHAMRGLSLFIPFTTIHLYFLGWDQTSILLNIATCSLCLINILVARSEKFRNNKDAFSWVFALNNSIALICTLICSFINQSQLASAIMSFTLILAITDTSWALTKRAMQCQMAIANIGLIVCWYMYLRDNPNGVLYLATTFLVMAWKALNIIAQFKLVQFREKLVKDHTFQSTIAGFNHEFRNTANILSGSIESIRENPADKVALDVLDRNMYRLLNLIQSVNEVTIYSETDYAGDEKVATFKPKKAA